MYTGFAEIYDELMTDVDYDAWADFYCKMMEGFGIRGGKLAECACGTGGLTLPLFRHGFHVTGVDLSQDMLWRAAQKARAQGMAIPFVRQDMRQLRLHRPMDAVLATCDGVNYLLDDVDVLEFFSSAYQALRPVAGFSLIFPRPISCGMCWGTRLSVRICQRLPTSGRIPSMIKPRCWTCTCAFLSSRKMARTSASTKPSARRPIPSGTCLTCCTRAVLTG